jgi:hypothetical protein
MLGHKVDSVLAIAVVITLPQSHRHRMWDLLFLGNPAD